MRERSLKEGLIQYYEGRLEQHGYAGGHDAVRSIMGLDAQLNAQGLIVWLERL